MQLVMKYNMYIVLIFHFFSGDRVPEWLIKCKTLKATNNVTDKKAENLLVKGDTKFNFCAEA